VCVCVSVCLSVRACVCARACNINFDFIFLPMYSGPALTAYFSLDPVNKKSVLILTYIQCPVNMVRFRLRENMTMTLEPVKSVSFACPFNWTVLTNLALLVIQKCYYGTRVLCDPRPGIQPIHLHSQHSFKVA
jgi:hypothetical protein